MTLAVSISFENYKVCKTRLNAHINTGESRCTTNFIDLIWKPFMTTLFLFLKLIKQVIASFPVAGETYSESHDLISGG